MQANSEKRRNLRLGFGLGLGGLLVVVALALALSSAGADSEASAKEKAKADQKDLVKTLKVVSVESPASFSGSNPYPTRATAGQRLLAITVDFDRSFQQHLRSSEAGEVYLSDNTGRTTYYTVDTGIPRSAGPGKKPERQATFVFAVPQAVGDFTFHYGALYAVPVSLGKK